MTDFDQTKALREEIAGMIDVIGTISKRANHLEQKHVAIEAEFNALIKIKGFAQAELARKQTILRKLME